MKREILFRAQMVDNGEWVEGDLIQLDNQVCMCSNSMWATEILGGLIELECVEVNPETVCQFTGLTDKNGTKIFEGDIVNIKSGEEYMYIREIDKNYVVKFSYGSFNPVDIDEVHYDFGNIDEFELIGNIFDSHELLK